MKTVKAKKKFKNPRVLLALIFLIFLIGLSIFWYFYSPLSQKTQVQNIRSNNFYVQPASDIPTPIPTPFVPSTIMVTYTDLHGHFSFSYPGNLTIEDDSQYKPYSFSLNNASNMSGDYVSIVILQEEIPASLSLKDLIAKDTYQNLPNGKMGSIIHEPIQSYTVKSYEAYSFSGGAESNYKYVYIRNGQNAIVFLLGGYQTGSSYTDNPWAASLLDKIIATLQFN